MGSSTARASTFGLHDGATENTGAIKALLIDLAERADESCVAVGVCAGIVAYFVGCTAVAQRALAPTSDLTGVWIGNFTLGCVPPLAGPHCLIRQDISFTFVQHQATVSGFYQCSFKDQPCIAHQHGGRVTRIDNTRHVLLIKVRMDDGSSCTFGATAYQG
jgi:hypothetical protein